MTSLRKPEDPVQALAAVIQEMDEVREEHLDVTGKPASHIDRCARLDLHERLVLLHMKRKALTDRIAQADRIPMPKDPRRI